MIDQIDLTWEKEDKELVRLLTWWCGLTQDIRVNLLEQTGTRVGEERLGPNSLCICGSGRKWKKCCMNKV